MLGRAVSGVPSTRKALFVLGTLSLRAAHTSFVQQRPKEGRKGIGHRRLDNEARRLQTPSVAR